MAKKSYFRRRDAEGFARVRTVEEQLEDFFDSIEISDRDKCWPWIASKNVKGYGQISFCGKMWLAHRAAWTIFNSYIPKGKLVCHHCDNPSCCNPFHLFLGTAQDNTNDAIAKKRLPTGERAGTSKLTDAEVLEMRALHRKGVMSVILAKQFRVSTANVCRIVNGNGWVHLVDTPTKLV